MRQATLVVWVDLGVSPVIQHHSRPEVSPLAEQLVSFPSRVMTAVSVGLLLVGHAMRAESQFCWHRKLANKFTVDGAVGNSPHTAVTVPDRLMVVIRFSGAVSAGSRVQPRNTWPTRVQSVGRV